MILEANLRDVKVKCRKLRNAGNATGLLVRNDGSHVAISVKGSDLDKFLKRFGDHSEATICLNGEEINTVITNVERHLVLHNAINIDLKELNNQ